MPKSDQGINNPRYTVVPRTLIFIFNDRSQVLLLKGAKQKKLWAGLYNGIGGHIEPDEDIYRSAERELLEESGITGVPLMLCGQIMVKVSEAQGVGIFIFKGKYAGVVPGSSIEGDLEWVDLDRLADTPLVEDLYRLIPKVAGCDKNDPLIIGHYFYDADDVLVMDLRQDRS